MKLLVVGDPHAHSQYTNDRFVWLGKFIADERPDEVLCMGDLYDMPSLCKHSKPIEVEGARVRADIDVGHDALEKVEEGVSSLNLTLAEGHRKRYRPRKILLIGNHGARLDEFASSNPALEGLLSTDAVFQKARDLDWEVHPFKEIVDVGGFQCSHFLPSGVMGKPIGGVTQGRSLLLKGHQSAIVGHSHLYNHGSVTRWDGAKLHGLSAGCFVHPEYDEPWCRQTRPMWDLGVLLLDGVHDGDYRSKTWVTIEELQRRYG